MKCHIPGLRQVAPNVDDTLEGLFLIRVERAFYRWHAGQIISGRLYCTPKALWKLGWFLRDFGYDSDLLGRDEVDEKALLGLRGIVRVSHTTLNGRCFLNLEGFAPAAEWDELSAALVSTPEGREAGDDL